MFNQFNGLAAKMCIFTSNYYFFFLPQIGLNIKMYYNQNYLLNEQFIISIK